MNTINFPFKGSEITEYFISELAASLHAPAIRIAINNDEADFFNDAKLKDFPGYGQTVDKPHNPVFTGNSNGKPFKLWRWNPNKWDDQQIKTNIYRRLMTQDEGLAKLYFNWIKETYLKYNGQLCQPYMHFYKIENRTADLLPKFKKEDLIQLPNCNL